MRSGRTIEYGITNRDKNKKSYAELRHRRIYEDYYRTYMLLEKYGIKIHHDDVAVAQDLADGQDRTINLALATPLDAECARLWMRHLEKRDISERVIHAFRLGQPQAIKLQFSGGSVAFR
jgi:hypothetical protein